MIKYSTILYSFGFTLLFKDGDFLLRVEFFCNGEENNATDSGDVVLVKNVSCNNLVGVCFTPEATYSFSELEGEEIPSLSKIDIVSMFTFAKACMTLTRSASSSFLW